MNSSKPASSAAVKRAPFFKPDQPWNYVVTAIWRLSIRRRSFWGVLSSRMIFMPRTKAQPATLHSWPQNPTQPALGPASRESSQGLRRQTSTSDSRRSRIQVPECREKAPLTFPGMLSTTEHCGQSRLAIRGPLSLEYTRILGCCECASR